jgi:hypothetical protein
MDRSCLPKSHLPSLLPRTTDNSVVQVFDEGTEVDARVAEVASQHHTRPGGEPAQGSRPPRRWMSSRNACPVMSGELLPFPRGDPSSRLAVPDSPWSPGC